MTEKRVLKGILAAALCAAAWLLAPSGLQGAPLEQSPKSQKEAPEAPSSVAQWRRRMAETSAYILRYHNNSIPPEKALAYGRYVLEAAERYSLDPALLTGLIIVESRGKANARSPYAVGLMQVYWKLHRKAIRAQFPHIKTEARLMEPRNNIFVGSWLFSQYMLNCKGDERRALHRYLGATSDRYVDRVLKYREHFNKRLDKISKGAS